MIHQKNTNKKPLKNVNTHFSMGNSMTSPGLLFGGLLFFDGLVAFIGSLIVLKRNSHNVLNRIGTSALFSFMVFFISESLIFILPVTEYFNYFEIIRDLAEIGAIMASMFSALGGLYVLKGSNFKHPLIIAPLGMFTLLGVISLIGDYVFYDAVNDALIFRNDIFGKVGIYLVPLVLVCVSIGCFGYTFFTVSKGDPLRRQLLLLMLGLISILIGLVYYSVIGFAVDRLGLIGIAGHVFYTISSILLTVAFSTQTNPNQPKPTQTNLS